MHFFKINSLKLAYKVVRIVDYKHCPKRIDEKMDEPFFKYPKIKIPFLDDKQKDKYF